MKIIYPNDLGTVSVIFPIDEDNVLEVARKDVPYQVPYLIVPETALPLDKTFRNAWQADFSNPTGFGLGAQRWFIEKAEQEIANGKNVPENLALINQMKAEIFKLEGIQL